MIERLINKLSKSNCFLEYKWIKSQDSFVLKTQGGFKKIELQNWESINTKGELSILIRPLFFVRFNILHNWFVPFSFKSKADQRCNYSIIFDGDDLGMSERFYFSIEKDDFNDVYPELETMLINGVKYFDKFKSIEDIYNDKVLPLFKENCVLETHGAEWIFESLLLTHLTEPSKFNILKEKLKIHTKKMNEKGEPNVVEYYPRWDEIIEGLTSVTNN